MYDATRNATATFTDDRLFVDVFTVVYTGALFDDKNVGTGKNVTVSGISLTGTDAGNYTPNETATTTADITQKPLAVTAVAASKVWDGNTTATITSLSATPISGDVVAPITYSSASFDTPDVGNNKPVTVNGVAFTGTDGPNYSVITPVTTTGSINAWSLAGFYAPVDVPAGGSVWNVVKGGATVPLKFEVFAGTTELTNPGTTVKPQPDGFKVIAQTCPNGAVTTDDIEFTTTGGTTLRYDATAGQFIQNWQTPKKPNTCYKTIMTTMDGSTKFALFMLK
jgi:hypothetical protein